MNILKRFKSALVVLFGLMVGAVSMHSHAVPDAAVTAAITAANTGFTDNFSPVAVMFVGISVSIAVLLLAVRWFRKAAK